MKIPSVELAIGVGLGVLGIAGFVYFLIDEKRSLELTLEKVALEAHRQKSSAILHRRAINRFWRAIGIDEPLDKTLDDYQEALDHVIDIYARAKQTELRGLCAFDVRPLREETEKKSAKHETPAA